MLICCVILMISHILDQQCHAFIGGREVVPHSRPYMVLVERMRPGNRMYCSGFLLNEDYVMTAADCHAESHIVFLGVHNTNPMNDGVQNITVERAFPHKNFDRYSFLNNMMLLKLSSKAKFNNRVGPISISGQGEGRQPRSCSVAGWGGADWDEPYMTSELNEINFTLIDDQYCVKNSFYCSPGPDGFNMGDVGSPLVCDGYAFGVASFMYWRSPNTPKLFLYSKLPDSRKLAELLLDRPPVCGRAADSNKKSHVKDEI